MASSSTGAGNTSDPMGKLGIGLAIWVTPLPSGGGKGGVTFLLLLMKWGGAISYSSQRHPYQKEGERMLGKG